MGMYKKIAVVRTNKTSNVRETYYILHESIYDIRKNSNTLYIMKNLMELEKRIDKNSYSYELKLIDDEDYETYLVNCNLNGRETPHSGSYFSFLVYFARSIDERITSEPSKLYISNNNYDTLKNWMHKRLKEFDPNKTPKK